MTMHSNYIILKSQQAGPAKLLESVTYLVLVHFYLKENKMILVRVLMQL